MNFKISPPKVYATRIIAQQIAFVTQTFMQELRKRRRKRFNKLFTG